MQEKSQTHKKKIFFSSLLPNLNFGAVAHESIHYPGRGLLPGPRRVRLSPRVKTADKRNKETVGDEGRYCKTIIDGKENF